MIPERRRLGVFLNASDMYFSGVLYDTFRERARAMNAFEVRLDRLQEKVEYPFRVQSSIGACQVKLREGISLNQCILRSDKMMYEIKRQRHEKGSPR